MGLASLVPPYLVFGKETLMTYRCASITGLTPIALFAATLMVCGCGGQPTYSVAGKVTFRDGTPLTAGQVEFQAVDRPISAVGYIAPDGTFELNTIDEADGAFTGTYKVAVKPPPAPIMDPGQPEKTQEELAARKAWFQKVPVRYHSPETSGIELVVGEDASENRFVIVVEGS